MADCRKGDDRVINFTTKELSALEDQLSSEQTLIKKYTALASQCADQSIKSSLQSIAQRHQQHYDKLMSYLG